MLKSEMEHIVDKHLSNHFKNDTFSKSELKDILVDILYDFGKSKSLSDTVEKNINDKQKRSLRLQGIK